MTISLIIRPEAERDLNEAYRWYERQFDGLGQEFVICIDAVLSVIRRTPKISPKIYKDIRRALIRRFPYMAFSTFLSGTRSLSWRFCIPVVTPARSVAWFIE